MMFSTTFERKDSMKTVTTTKLVLVYAVLGISSIAATSLISSLPQEHNLPFAAQSTQQSLVTQVSDSTKVITAGMETLDAGQGKASVGALKMLDDSLSRLGDVIHNSTSDSPEAVFQVQQVTDRTKIATAKVQEEVKAWNTEEARRANIISESAFDYTNADYISRVRHQLDSLGGKNVDIVWSEDICGLDWAMGCVMYPDVSQIVLSPEVSTLDEYSSYILITHEYAHIVIGKVDPVDYLMNNAKLLDVFPAAPNVNETLADCMAEVVTGSTSGTYMDSCTPEQLEIAQDVWDGNQPLFQNSDIQ